MLTFLLDAGAVTFLSAFAWFWWPPLVLLVLGVACLYVSWARS